MIQDIKKDVFVDSNGNKAEMTQYLDMGNNYLDEPCIMSVIWMDKDFCWNSCVDALYKKGKDA